MGKVAIVESSESSNRLEGITAPKTMPMTVGVLNGGKGSKAAQVRRAVS